MSENLAIRPVTRLDYEQWLPLWRGYNAFYGRAGETALHPDVTQMTWSRFFDAYEPMHALVAESGDRLVGLNSLHIPPQYDLYPAKLLSAGSLHR